MSAKISFDKYCGTGNDFIVLDNRTGSFDQQDQALWQRICDRRFGVGADGVLFFDNSDEYDFEMAYLNADGGEVGMCGNGARVLTSFAKKIQFDKTDFKFKTRDGVYSSSVLKSGLIKLEMTQLSEINTIDVSDLITSKDSFFMDTGVPHCVYFLDSLDNIPLIEWGAKVRYDKRFSEGANANFVEIIDEGHLKVRTYERGVEGETLACGTGATACAWAYRELYKQIDHIKIDVPGGELEVLFEDEKVYLSGKVEKIFSGVFEV
ncbi:diaminopimelate epimerase [Halobacteriovorax marinus]|uniref:diaminopimelate epimerase n=1 Tax=Halobacteriovorax marinus TaxID=97084 RepID=UPI003A94B788